MLTHVVLFALKDPADAEPTAAILRGMAGRIPTLRSVEVGLDALPSERSMHLALITRHDDRAGLAAYAAHPVHQEVLAHMRQVVERSVKVDFES